MLGQTEGIQVFLVAQTTDIITDFIFNLGQLGSRLLRYHDHIQGRIYVSGPAPNVSFGSL